MCTPHSPIGNGPDHGLDFGLMAGVMWLDDVIDLMSRRSTGEPTAPTLVTLAGTTGIQVPSWSGTALTEVSLAGELQHHYAEGMAIRPHIHWRPTTTGAGNVRFGIEVAVEVAGLAKWVTTLTVDAATLGVANEIQNTEIGELVIPATHAKIGAQIAMRFYRDGAADSYNSAVTTATFGNHYPVNSYGSRGVFTK